MSKRYLNVLTTGDIKDTHTEKLIRGSRIGDELNKLYEENEQLKQAYAQLRHRHSLLHDECIDAECDRDSYCKDIASLEKENEQLKSFNQDLSENLSVCADKRLAQGEHLTKLTNENEQLKHSIKCLEADKMELQQYIKRMQGDVE